MALTEAQKRTAAKNKAYWKSREEEQLKHNITDEKAYDAEVRRILTAALDGIQKELNAFYGRYAKTEGITIAEAKKRVTQADIAEWERKAAKYVKERDFSEQANEEMRQYNATMRLNRLEMLKANMGLELLAGFDELDKFMQGVLRGRTEDELTRQAGILGKTVRNPAKYAAAIVNGSFHNATFSDRIWLYQDALRMDIGKLVTSGLIQGKNPRVLAREIRSTFDASRYNAERLMRTELARVQTEAQKHAFQRNGFDMYTFIANVNPSKNGTCDICRALDGKHFKVKDMMPGENAPPMHPHCRCSTAAHEDSAEYQAWLDYIADGGTTEEWNAFDKTLKSMLIKNKREEMKRAEAEAKAASFDITEGGKYKKLPYSYAQRSEYQAAMRPEYYAQRMTHSDNDILWHPDYGYIQNGPGYTAINSYLRGLEPKIESKYTRTIETLDRRTSKPALKHDYVGFRKVDASYLQKVLGIDMAGKTAARRLKTRLGGSRTVAVPKDTAAAQSIVDSINALVGTAKARVLDSGYTSISLAEDINYFTHYPIQFEIQMPEGTRGLITNNWQESEFIAQPGTALDIIGAEVYDDGEKICIRIFSRLIQE